MSIFNIVNSFDEAWKAVILPGRQEYTVSDLGPTDFSVQGNRIQRTDFRLLNKRGHIIECSFFQHVEIEDPIPCVVYLHANGCCRLEALQYSDLVLSNRISLFCFDFSGSGKSDGLYSSVGWFEQEDLECIIQYLYQTGRVSKVAVWGRSMGAITTILYAEKDPRINCIILDSPFSNFKKLVKETAKNKASIPGFLSNGAFSLIRKTILNKAKFDIDHLRPIKYVEKIKIPALFGAAKDDSFVVPQHTKDLYYAYGGPKQLVIFDGDHNTERPYTWLLEVKEFITKHLLSEDIDVPQPIIKSFKTYFGTGENSQDNNDKSFSGAQKVNDHPLKKAALSPQDSLQDHKPMTFTWLEHSASTPNLPSMDEIFKNENSSDRLTKEVNDLKSAHSKDAAHLNKQHSTPYPHAQKTYTIEPISKNQQKTAKPELRKAVTVQFNLQEGSKTSRLPLKEYLDHSNTQSFPTLPEYSYKSTSPNSAYSELGKMKASNQAHYPSPYQNDTKKTNITLKEKVSSAPSQNPLQHYKPSVYTIEVAQYKTQKTAPELPNSYSTSSLNSVYQPKLQHSETLPSLTFTSQTQSLNELPSESNRVHGVLTTRSGELDSTSSNRTASNKSFTSIVEHERYYKENVSPALQRRKPLTYQINLNSSVPIINPNESNPNYGFLDVNKGGAFNENRRASENVSNLLKKLITPQSGDFGANYHQAGKTHYKI